MALHPTKLLLPSDTNRANGAAPLAGTRSQSVQRLQVGLIGLAAMILLVGLAGIITSRAEQTEAGVVPEAASTSSAGTAAAAASDPLADAGVVPDMPSSAAPAGAANPNARSTLQP
jgi:hypothetical protein